MWALVDAHRVLQDDPRASTSTDGTVAILIVVSILFCCVWIPGVCRRCQIRNSRMRQQETDQAVANLMRQSLEIQRRAREAQGGAAAAGGMRMSLQERRALLESMLVTKHVVLDSDETRNATAVSSEEAAGDVESGMRRIKSDLVLSAVSLQPEEGADTTIRSTDDPTTSDNHHPGEPCAICLTEYSEGDEICWSHNAECHHVFHRECIIEWLLQHEECPCCRHDFLNVADQERNERDQTGTTITTLEDIHSDFVLSILEYFLDTRQEARHNMSTRGLELAARTQEDEPEIVLEDDEIVLEPEVER